MNLKATSAACLFAALTGLSITGHAETTASQPDIHQVVSITEEAGSSALCGIVNSHLTYLDSQGQRHVLDYRKFSSNCLEGS
ncbi:DUF2790 domain-containing protein [Pseudomonas sp. AN3A02]|jgi:hypothetical protein|uniref:DUF2790 domain-containing protein n=1 Tax=Pseudomonas sp. AN3A02 TaxID=2719587 RepID=UPI00142F8BC0|nr:DUF2790 domain-containing protein [Pseudomonas sp. AN3A02]NIL20328.1 DUF2790 domain-containing protein [Pseudomonas sp. AN3A02]